MNSLSTLALLLSKGRVGRKEVKILRYVVHHSYFKGFFIKLRRKCMTKFYKCRMHFDVSESAKNSDKRKMNAQWRRERET